MLGLYPAVDAVDVKPPYDPSIQYIGGHPLGPDGGLIAHWLMNEGGGNTVFDHVGLNDGTLLNGPVWIGGKFFGSALELNGTDSYIRVPAPSTSVLVDMFPFTISAWVYIYATGSYDRVVDKWRLRFEARNGVLYGQRNFSTTPASTQGDTTLATGTWYHVVCTLSDIDNKLRLYINGIEDSYFSQTAGVGDLSSDAAAPYLGIGAEYDYGSNYWDGIVDNVSIYDRLLTEDKLAQLAAEPFCMIEPQYLEMWYVEAAAPSYIPKAILVM